MSNDETTPCKKVDKVYPSGATQQEIICIDTAYTQYSDEIDGCSGDHTCCETAKGNYYKAWTGCTGLPHPT